MRTCNELREEGRASNEKLIDSKNKKEMGENVPIILHFFSFFLGEKGSNKYHYGCRSEGCVSLPSEHQPKMNSALILKDAF